jgi:hypothetical protein
MKLEVMVALVLVALGLSSCIAARHRGTSGVESSNRPVIHPVAPAPGQAQAHSLTAPSAIYVADFDIDPASRPRRTPTSRPRWPTAPSRGCASRRHSRPTSRGLPASPGYYYLRAPFPFAGTIEKVEFELK